jgi:hypothetical protein
MDKSRAAKDARSLHWSEHRNVVIHLALHTWTIASIEAVGEEDFGDDLFRFAIWRGESGMRALAGKVSRRPWRGRWECINKRTRAHGRTLRGKQNWRSNHSHVNVRTITGVEGDHEVPDGGYGECVSVIDSV